MKIPMTFLRLGSVVAALLALALIPACEDTSVDTSDLDSYFANNPYVSDPRTGPGSDVVINPSAASVSIVGQEVVFSATGGNQPYSWHVANEANGSIMGRGTQGDYKATRLANNNVIVYDVDGHAAIATITGGSAGSLAISPASATIPTSAGNTIQFTAIGGQAPYMWSISAPGIATITQDGLYTSKAASAGSVNTVTVTDAAGKTVSATVTHGTAFALSISPTSATVPASAGHTIQFIVTGGRAPYTWSLSKPDIATISGSGLLTSKLAPGGSLNVITVIDQDGKAVSATVTHGQALAVSPSSTTISAGNSVTFTAAGGDGSYNWQVANITIGTPASGSGVTFTYTATPTSSNMVNTVTLSDGSGASATATITHH